jgi:DnaJ-class molecular chaperone
MGALKRHHHDELAELAAPPEITEEPCGACGGEGHYVDFLPTLSDSLIPREGWVTCSECRGTGVTITEVRA